jgi:transposase
LGKEGWRFHDWSWAKFCGAIMPCLVTLSYKELHRLEAVRKIRERRLSVTQAVEVLHLSRSQVHRLLQAYDRDGADGLASKKRGRPSNRRHADDFRNLVLDLVRERYADFGPTLACEKLLERHEIALSKETLRKWMTEAGLWKSRRERRRQIFQPRSRRDCLGELVQIDGSHHWWFEGRGPKCALLVYIDDATGKLLHLRFAGSENTFDYFHATKARRDEPPSGCRCLSEICGGWVVTIVDRCRNCVIRC